MSLDLGAARTMLATALQTISGLQVYAYAPAKPEMPAAVIEVDVVTPHIATDSFDIVMKIIVLTPMTPDWPQAQKVLDAYVNTGTPSSVIDACEANPSLQFVAVDSYGRLSLNDTEYASIVFHVGVLA